MDDISKGCLTKRFRERERERERRNDERKEGRKEGMNVLSLVFSVFSFLLVFSKGR